MSFHRDAAEGDRHPTPDVTYADIAARDADTDWNTNAENVDKIAKVTIGPVYYFLATVAPTWVEITTVVSNALAGVLVTGNNTGGTDIVVDSGDAILVNDAITIGSETAPTTDSAIDLTGTDKAVILNRLTTAEKNLLTPSTGMVAYDTDIDEPQHVNNALDWVGPSASDTLAEILAKGNTTGGTDIVVSTSDVITITDAPSADTDGANKLYVDGQVAIVDTLAEILASGNVTGGTDIVVETGDVVTIIDAPAADTNGVNKLYADELAIYQGSETFSTSTDTATLGVAAVYMCDDTTAQRTLTISSADIAKVLTIGGGDRVWSFGVLDISGNAGTNSITIDTEGTEKINGVDSIEIAVNYGSAVFTCDGSNIFVRSTS